MSATQATDAPAGQPTARPEQPDVFLSYSRKDSDFAPEARRGACGARQGGLGRLGGHPGDGRMARRDRVGDRRRRLVRVRDQPGLARAPRSAARSWRTRSSTGSESSRSCYRDANGLAVPPELSSRNWIFFRAEDDFHDAVEHVRRGARDRPRLGARAHATARPRARVGAAEPRQEPAAPRLRPARSRAPACERPSPQAEPQPTQLQREYTLASRRAQSRRQRITIAAVGIALAVTVVLAVLAWIAAKRRDRQRAHGPVERARDGGVGPARDQPGAERPARPASGRPEAHRGGRKRAQARALALERDRDDCAARWLGRGRLLQPGRPAAADGEPRRDRAHLGCRRRDAGS